MTIGPFSFPAGLLLAFAAVMVALYACKACAARTGGHAERLLWLCIIVAVLAGRAAFVVHYRAVYAEAPLQMLDMRDGGISPSAGIASGLLLGALLVWCRRTTRKPVLVGVIAGTLTWVAGTALLSGLNNRQRLPEMNLTDMNGNIVELASLAGQPVVINLWASWCPPCRREMPALSKGQRMYRDVRFVFVNQGEAPDMIQRYLAAQGLVLDNVLVDRTNRLAYATASPGLPTTLFFNSRGELVDRRLGEISAATLAERIDILKRRAGGGNIARMQFGAGAGQK